jgi:hypothetical protein
MHARFSNLWTGRFTGTDIFPATLNIPQGWNRYAYVRGRATTRVDPKGLFPCPGLESVDCQTSITVIGEDPWKGTTTNANTGLQGLSALKSGSSFLDSISSLGVLTDLRPSDFSFRRTASISGQGLAAFADGVLPFVDPFKDAGVYDPEDLGLQYSQDIGALTRDVELTLASTGSDALFGGGTWANKGRYLRVGHSFTKGKTWFSIRGEWVDRLVSTQGAHIYFWIIRSGR